MHYLCSVISDYMTQQIHRSDTLPKLQPCNTGIAFVSDGGVYMDKPILLHELGALYPTSTSKRKFKYGYYKCQYCCNFFKSTIRNVNIEHTKSCGCYKVKISHEPNTHGLFHHPLYRRYRSMISRCYHKSSKRYDKYGGKGVTVCDEWKNSFASFIKWCEENGYKKELIIDRIDVNGNYEPSNCRFIDDFKSNQNTSLIQKNNTSGYRGVSWEKRSQKWLSQIVSNGKIKYLGRYNDPWEAAKAYNQFVINNSTLHPLNQQRQ